MSVRERDGFVALSAPRTTALALNRVFALGVTTPLRAASLDALIAEYRAAMVARFLIAWAPIARPENAREWFEHRGFRKIIAGARLFRRTDQPLDATNALTVIEAGPGDATVFGATAARGNNLPSEFEPGFNSTFGHPGWRHYLALDGTRPVAAAALYVEGDVAWSGFAGTIPGDRRRGAQSALLARRIHDAAAMDARWIGADHGLDAPQRAPHPAAGRCSTRALAFEQPLRE